MCLLFLFIYLFLNFCLFLVGFVFFLSVVAVVIVVGSLLLLFVCRLGFFGLFVCLAVCCSAFVLPAC